MKVGGMVMGPSMDIVDSVLPTEQLDSPEDIIAGGETLHLSLQSSAGSDLSNFFTYFAPGISVRVMHHAILSGVLIATPKFGLVEALNLGDEGGRRLQEEENLVFRSQDMLLGPTLVTTRLCSISCG